jgi:hypothetical protein
MNRSVLAPFLVFLLSLLGIAQTALANAPTGSPERRMPRKRLAMPANIKADDELEMANGKKIKARDMQELADRFQAFAEEKGLDLSDGKDGEVEIPLDPKQKERTQISENGFQGRLVRLRALKADRWKSKIRKRTAKFDSAKLNLKTLNRVEKDSSEGGSK